ncbi:MAG: RNA polymerase sigma factor [Eubacteriales bacterium]|nr:RNA polymerase sigma factor [Eubacteriales bacterium]
MENSSQADYTAIAETLYIKYSKDVLRVSYFYLGNVQQAEDVMQEVFVKLLLNKPVLEPGKEKAWLLAVAFNLCRDIWRSGWTKRVFAASNKLVFYPNQNSDIEDLADKVSLMQALHQLSPTLKETMLLYYYQNYTIDEIAEILNTTSGTIASRLSRGRDKLKNILERGVGA